MPMPMEARRVHFAVFLFARESGAYNVDIERRCTGTSPTKWQRHNHSLCGPPCGHKGCQALKRDTETGGWSLAKRLHCTRPVIDALKGHSRTTPVRSVTQHCTHCATWARVLHADIERCIGTVTSATRLESQHFHGASMYQYPAAQHENQCLHEPVVNGT